MLYLGTTPLAGNIKTKLFTSSGTFVVPADVYCIWIDGCGGGGGGGGGDPTPGGGGGGGGAATGVAFAALAVTPGETLTLVIGSAGNGGASGSGGTDGGDTIISRGATAALKLVRGNGGRKGANPNGGDGGQSNFTGGPAGGSGAGLAVIGNSVMNAVTASGVPAGLYYRAQTGAAGGALGYDGGSSFGGSMADPYGAARSAGGVNGGGGGNGGHCTFGQGGVGGANGEAGAHATGYGAGGGGGSGNAPGGNGSPGFARIYYISKYTIA